jgi:hypothetical protein
MRGKMLTGGCFCGKVRYRSTAPLYPATLCHCRSCRRAAGAHVVAWATVRRSEYTVERGRPVEYSSSPGVIRTFCGDCGTPLTYWRRERAEEIDVTIGSLDDPDAVVPADHIWMQDAPSWDGSTDSLPRHLRTRGS